MSTLTRFTAPLEPEDWSHVPCSFCQHAVDRNGVHLENGTTAHIFNRATPTIPPIEPPQDDYAPTCLAGHGEDCPVWNEIIADFGPDPDRIAPPPGPLPERELGHVTKRIGLTVPALEPVVAR